MAARRPSEPKRHHHVPRAHLERFAADGKVRVRRRDGTVHETSPINVAVESGFYDVALEDQPKSTVVELALTEVENSAWAAFEAIDRTSRPPQGSDREALADFIALQMTRTTRHREMALFPKRVTDWAGDREITRDLVREYLATQHLGHEPEDGEVEGAFVHVSQHLADPTVVTHEWAIEMMLENAALMVKRVLALHWTFSRSKRRFFTSDIPVLPWRKPTRRDHLGGLAWTTPPN